MNALDQIIADALAGSPETHVAMLAREVVRLREAAAVVVPERAAWLTIDEMANALVLEFGTPIAAAKGFAKAIADASIAKGSCAIPADRVLGEGVVALRRFAERCAQRDHQPDEHIGRAKCVACEAEDALRANQGADHD